MKTLALERVSQVSYVSSGSLKHKKPSLLVYEYVYCVLVLC